jgi:hypothetical protein
LNTMFLKKVGPVATSLLILSGLAASGGLWARQDSAQPTPSQPLSTAPALAPASAPAAPTELTTARLDPVAVQAQTQTQKKATKAEDGPRELALDDGKMKGRKSIGGGGHAVRFEAPGDGWTLTSVRIHGSRYGYPQAPREDFKIFLCDDKFQLITEFPFPYSKFQRGDAKWVTFDVKPTKVPRTFILGVNFDPAQTKGVYLSHDAQGSGKSMVGLPGDESRPFEQGDWLIRAKVAPGK